MRLRRAGALVVSVALALALATACSDDDSEGGDRPSTSLPGPAFWPLRGTPAEGAGRPALAVKIDNTDAGRPQAGLAEADVVYEEVVEGGLTRLLAVYHSEDPASVGPVRSARSTDLGVLAELGRPLFAWSGANPTFRAAVEAADLVDVGVGAEPAAYRRADDRRAPYNLYAAPEDLRAATDDGRLPGALFTYRSAGEPAAGEPAAGYTASTRATTLEWRWDPEAQAWARSQNGTSHVDADGDRVQATNVVVRTTEYRDSGVRDSRGAVVPEAVLVGEGDAWLLSDGRAVPARWRKPGPEAPTVFTAVDGAPLLLTPGTTWVEVLPPGTGDVVRA